MKITVHAEKVRAELLSTEQGTRDRLSAYELDVLVATLRGERPIDIAKRLGRAQNNISQALCRARHVLGVRSKIDLAYVAYERGYVVIEEAA